MPKPQEILLILESIANRYLLIAIGCHLFVAAIVILLLLNRKLPNRWLCLLTGLPVISVSVLNFLEGNPFNGIVFSGIMALLIISCLKAGKDVAKPASTLSLILGIIMVLYGFFYPHFLISGSWTIYLYAAPTGLIPCPTLALLVGFAMIYNGFYSKVWSITLIVAGIFYGIFGIFRLKVYLDVVLLAGTLLFLLQVILSGNFKKSRNNI